VPETERNALQRFSVSIELDFDLKRAGESDHLHDTIDYEAVSNNVLSVGQSRSFSLLEAMAEEMAAGILSQFPVKGVTIFLKKIVPPVPAIRGYFAVKIFRAR
jgi:dihydroneopterin aldolase